MTRTDFGTLPRAKVGKLVSTAASRAHDVKDREAVYLEGFADGRRQALREFYWHWLNKLDGRPAALMRKQARKEGVTFEPGEPRP